MGNYFIVSNTEGLNLLCIYYGNKKSNVIRNKEKISQGDILEILDEGKFILGLGWYVLVIINNEQSVFASISELEKGMEKKELQSLIDLELEHNYLKYQVERALILKNKELFKNVINQYKDFHFLKKKSRVGFLNI
ncbi:hypothetical protein QA612_16655 [Evansella sp. AB-P1]|uniref:hypothetical protein n=1 Tax=Evansella sp. AB-P1 TaxID=3037653 RepID=UPI00241F714E|nr:hypothetical protein [Evansella sp. AB-P1]MDG5789089.1 hypothetical protein [Evansella sp. AB-P1]